MTTLKFSRFVCRVELFVVCLLISPLVRADLVLSLSGVPESPIVSYSASGSIIIGIATGSNNNDGLGRAPVGGTWLAGFDQNIGDFLNDSMDDELNDDLVLSNGGISYRLNGGEFGVFDTLDLDGASSLGGDEVELDPTNSIDYPNLEMGDVVSWTGAGTFTLEDGETFGSLFTATGTFQNAIDGGFFRVEISSVPEPASYAMIGGLGLAAMVGLRRFRCRWLGLAKA